MRSMTTDQRISVDNSMPGRYKSCRRSTSDLFCKGQEQELQNYAPSEVFMKEEEEQEEVTEQEQIVKMSVVTPPKLTPLRWRSTSMRELHGSSGVEVSGSPRPEEESCHIRQADQVINVPNSAQPVEEVRHVKSSKRPSQAQLRAQVMSSLSVEQANNAHLLERGSHAPPMKAPDTRENVPGNGVVNSAKPMDLVSSIEKRDPLAANSNDERRALNSAWPEDRVAELQRKEIVSENSAVYEGLVKMSTKLVPGTAEPLEDIIFKPVDLDEKYREKELVRHVTAAKIQNREEALLNNPGSPGFNNRKVPVGEEPAAMTIEFLRARLQAERSASKAIKLRMEQLSKKVLELESRLQVEVELRKSAENALKDSLLKLTQAAPQADQEIEQVASIPISGAQKVAIAREQREGESEKTVARVDVERNAELLESRSVSLGDKLPVANPSEKEKEPREGVGHEDGLFKFGSDKARTSATQGTPDTSALNGGGLWRDRSVSAQPSGQDGEHLQVASMDGERSELVTKESRDSSPERVLSPSRHRQEIRMAIEERLRTMWAKIGEEMAALAEVRGEEELFKKDGTRWMGQLPSAPPDKQSGDLGAVHNHQEDNLGISNQQVEAHGNRNIKPCQISGKVTATMEKRGSFRKNASLAKNVAKLVEQYEFQETAQREWEENFEAQQSLEHKEDELPALVTRDGDVVTESGSDPNVLLQKQGTAHKHVRTHSQGEKNMYLSSSPIYRSKSMGFLSSQKGVTSGGTLCKENGRAEILADNLIESGGDYELLYDPETEVAEELPNGIYLHHSREDLDPQRRAAKDVICRKTTERVGTSDGYHSPSRPDRAKHNRERFTRAMDLLGEVDHQGRPEREFQDRASGDIYHDSVINNRGARVDSPYSNPDRVVPDETMYRNGARWEVQGMDPNWVERQEERRVPPIHYCHPTSEEARGMSHAYRDRDHWEQDLQYRNTYRYREDAHKGMPPAWQEGGDPGLRNRGMNQKSYVYPSAYGMEEPQQGLYTQPGQYAEATGGYNGRREIQYMPHGAHNPRPDFYPPSGMSGPRHPINGYEQPDQIPASRGQAGWVDNVAHADRNVVVGVSEDVVPGEASEVLKALRIAKQQIKSSTGEQPAFMTAQYTVSQEHRYSAGGQVSKTSYTVEAPVGYPRVTKTVHEGWHLEGGKSSSKKRGGFVGPNGVSIDLTGANVTDLITGTGPLSVSGESSYVEKLNVGRGIQFFFSG